MKNPVFLDWNNNGNIGPADIATSYAVSENEREDASAHEQTPQSKTSSVGCLTIVSLLAVVPFVAFAIILASL